MRSTSSSWRPIVCSGFSAVIGSWKIMPIFAPRILRILSCGAWARSWPSNRIRPLPIRTCGPGKSPRIARATSDLPDPLSPIRQVTLPARNVRSISLTAFARSAPDGNAIVSFSSWSTVSFIAHAAFSSLAKSWIEGFVEPVAEEIDAEYREQDRNARKGADPPGGAQHRASRADDQPPAHDVGIAEAEKRETRLEQNGGADQKRADRDDGGGAVRQHVMEDDARVACAEAGAGLHEFAAAECCEFPAHQPRDAWPGDGRNRNDFALYRRGEDRNDQQSENECRDGLEEFRDPH